MASLQSPVPLSPTPADRSEWRRVLAISAVIVGSTLLPYGVHYARPVAGQQYTGLERFINDQCSYLMWINQVRRGEWLVSNLYVHDVEDRFLPNPLWAAIGLVGRWVSFGTTGLYHAARLAFGMGYLVVLFGLARRLFPDRLTRWAAWLLAALGGGIGWLYWAATGITDLRGLWVSADYMPEAWSYSSLLYFPHFAASLLLMVGCFCRLCDAWRGGGPWAAVHAGLLLGFLALVHTYTAVTVVAILVVHGLLWVVAHRRAAPVVWGTALALGTSALFFGVQAWQTISHEALWRWAENNVMPSPAPWSYVLGFGVTGVLGLWACGREWARGEDQKIYERGDAGGLILVAWVLATALLLYSSLPFERRCVEGLHIALAFLAAPLVVRGARRLSGGNARGARMLVAAFVAANMPTSVWYLLREIPSREGYVDSAVFAIEREAYRQLGAGAALLCDGALGQWVPVHGRLRVYLGHCQLSYDHTRRQSLIERFFNAHTSARERWALFKATACDGIIAREGQRRLLRGDRDASGGQLWVEAFTGPGDRLALFLPSCDHATLR